jgi:3-dehydroquinate synthase
MVGGMRIVKVPLGDRSYRIRIGENLLQGLGAECRRLGLGRSCVIITDDNVGPLYASQTEWSLQDSGFSCCRISIKAGEKSKNLRLVHQCYDQLAGFKLERNSFVLALGGGVVGDLAGFVAATFLRGIDFVQVPTSLLAQVDSSVGGKVGVNLKSGKNLVGAFHQPRLVLCDLDTLQTLPEREFRSGLAEVIKYGIIYDRRFFINLEKLMDPILAKSPETLSRIIARSCAIKANVVAQDERETGLRAILNYGHTIGHGLEAISGYGKYLHGEAISIGQVATSLLSVVHSGLAPKECDRIRQLFVMAGLPVGVRLNASQKKALNQAMSLDKKVRKGEIRFVLAKRIGEVCVDQSLPQSSLDSVLKQIAAF